ncbi:MAG TPA: hypothetical protein VFO05_01065 [Candidatus Limnocylindrales bacterium]|nr:hypothetical protein [Candidatus Limnocylindrales bacterium]
MRTRLALLLLLIGLVACAPAEPSVPVASAPASPARSAPPDGSPASPSSSASSASTSSLTLADAATCPVTVPVPAPPEFRDRLFGSAEAHGNDDLWVGGLGPDGVIPADPRLVESDGSIGWKLGWWRIAPGSLTITGRRIDAPAPPLRAPRSDDYGTTGFQPSGVSFPTEGCWEVTGTVGGSALTFVTFVIRT